MNAGVKTLFPYPGNKYAVVRQVWERIGDTPNFCEPFVGSGAVLFGRPPFEGRRVETINDLNGHVANVWRAIEADPDGVAWYAAQPVNELDLHARGNWLFHRPDVDEWVKRLRADPDFHDARAAGWWVWFASLWMGRLPSVVPGGKVARQRPRLGPRGRHSGAGSIARAGGLTAHLRRIADRLRDVRVLCGDWTRAVTPPVTVNHGLTAVFLDPPYSHVERSTLVYSDDTDVAPAVRRWAIDHGDDPRLRIVLCGFEGEHEMPGDWSVLRRQPRGRYGFHAGNRKRLPARPEVLWFSPHCLHPGETGSLFEIQPSL